jgi:hypothetical protein
MNDILAHIPYFAALIAGGLLGNYISDKGIKLPAGVYVALGIAFVISLFGAGYCIEHGPRALMLAFNALSAGCISFGLTSCGDFAKPQRVSR